MDHFARISEGHGIRSCGKGELPMSPRQQSPGQRCRGGGLPRPRSAFLQIENGRSSGAISGRTNSSQARSPASRHHVTVVVAMKFGNSEQVLARQLDGATISRLRTGLVALAAEQLTPSTKRIRRPAREVEPVLVPGAVLNITVNAGDAASSPLRQRMRPTKPGSAGYRHLLLLQGAMATRPRTDAQRTTCSVGRLAATRAMAASTWATGSGAVRRRDSAG